MRLASLAMYVSPPPLAEATARLWDFLRDRLRADGLSEVPDRLDDAVPYDEAWLDPQLLIAQTCGYPFVHRLRSKVRLVATPVYGYPGCDGPSTCSFIVVAKGSPATGLEDLRGSRAAINQPDSNSGMNLLRVSIAPLARDGRFFGAVVETGGHGASVDAVASGKADVAAIDCVSYGALERFAPERLKGLRVLAATPQGPGLPFITRGDASDAEVALLRHALQAAIDAPALADVRDTLSLRDITILEAADYQPLAQMAQSAGQFGYSVIA